MSTREKGSVPGIHGKPDVRHRSYTDLNDIQTDNYRSSLRNKLVAEGFYLINVIEKYGSGFIRIRRALKDYPEVQFDVQEFQGGVMATTALIHREYPTTRRCPR